LNPGRQSCAPAFLRLRAPAVLLARRFLNPDAQQWSQWKRPRSIPEASIQPRGALLPARWMERLSNVMQHLRQRTVPPMLP
jgi:hypothetical protein